jgi:hypothetical protein
VRVCIVVRVGRVGNKFSGGPIVTHGVVFSSSYLLCSSSVGSFATLEGGVAVAALMKARMRAAAAKRILAVVSR